MHDPNPEPVPDLPASPNEIAGKLDATLLYLQGITQRLDTIEAGLAETAEIASVFKEFGVMMGGGGSVPMLTPSSE